MRVRDSELAEKSVTRFFDALRDVLVGAKVEGDSGCINLVRIKSRYYTEGVFPKLQRDVEAALKPWEHDPNRGYDANRFGSCPQSQSFRQELFDKPYDFFHRYFSPSEKQGTSPMSSKGE